MRYNYYYKIYKCIQNSLKKCFNNNNLLNKLIINTLITGKIFFLPSNIMDILELVFK